MPFDMQSWPDPRTEGSTASIREVIHRELVPTENTWVTMGKALGASLLQ